MSKHTASATKRAKKLKNQTWEYPTGSGIKIAEIKNSTGGATYGVSYQIRIPSKLLGRVDKREMHQRGTEAEAKKLAEDRWIALKKHGTTFAEIPAAAQRQAALAWSMLNEHGIDLVEAAQAAIRHLRPAGGRVPLSKVLEELRLSKAARFAAGKLDKRTHDDFDSRSRKIERALGNRLTHELTPQDIKKWLLGLLAAGVDGKSAPLAARTVLNYRNTLAEVFHYATIKRHCAENPLDRFTPEEYKALGGEREQRNVDGINILTVEEAEKLLNAGTTLEHLPLLGSLVLRLFCGVRTTEVTKLDWSEVHWVDPRPYVHVTAAKAKKRNVRLVEIPKNALAWLHLCNPPKAGRVAPGEGNVKAYTKQFSRLIKAAGLGTKNEEGKWESAWESNDTRHSFGSFHFALHGDSIKTATLMGHKQGDDVLFSHYRTLVSKDDAERYFGLLPCRSGTIEAFPAAAIS